MTAIPTPREVLTSILSTLSAYDPKEHHHHHHQPASDSNIRSTQRRVDNYNNPPSNPLKLVPNSHRALLTTLHVLYPSTLLPALDLLDRRLVTRIRIPPSSSSLTNDPVGVNSDASAGPGRSFFLVRSAQQQHQSQLARHRQHHHTTTTDFLAANPVGASSTSTRAGGSGKVYVIRLDAWNCSCAAFAFSAFPPESSASARSASRSGHPAGTLLDRLRGGIGAGDDGGSEGAARQEEDDAGPGRPPLRKSAYDITPAATNDDYGGDGFTSVQKGEEGREHRPHEFGGLSTDGTPDSGIANVPCCKHLLACVLGERWSSLLGTYIEDRVVGREEAAGLYE
ncbi:hypothetical protein Micbo1qcDRAFT_155773 [Microdochium bolleyi]|uniref:SWIM-type domain-containing protein n=1 Tax=Microdochium bolleyi TaxID=196109 RepID=A0A136JIQ4_9PEZI|nr:hypothetical protein Micbo1qcDRAFT_155773 [Microdochium bolleyi]